MSTISYVRVTPEFSADDQRKGLALYLSERKMTVTDYCEDDLKNTLLPVQKRNLWAMMSRMPENSIVIAANASRLGRTPLEIMKVIGYALERKSSIQLLSSNLNLDSIDARSIAFCTMLCQEIECQLVEPKPAVRRVRARIDPLEAHHETIKKMLAEGVRQTVIAQKLCCTSSTLSHYIKSHELKKPKPQPVADAVEERKAIIARLEAFSAKS